MIPSIEALLGSHYRVLEEIGGGGMSRVLLAREEALGREVVIKVMEGGESPAAVERFTREIRLAAQLQHPNIVPLLSAGGTEGQLWYTMPFVKGRSLRDRLERGDISFEHARRILADVARALAYAHAQGVVHRDIKPENILLSDDVAVVTDFGIAKALASVSPSAGRTLTQVGAAIGTPAYMAPEQAAGDPGTDFRADIYAVGVIAYEMLSGKHPFARHKAAHQLIIAHLTETPPPVDLAGTGLEHLSALVARCLAKDPSERPSNAAEVLEAFQQRANVSAELVRRAAGSGTELYGVAVMPFINMSNERDAEYLSDGITDEIIGTLARGKVVRVAGRASCFALKGRGLGPQEVGEQLGVGAVVEGSVRRLGNRVRVSAELLDTRTGLQLWADRYDRDTTDLFALQDDIAREVAAALQTTLTRQPSHPGAAVATPEQVNPQAYNLYLQASHLCRGQLDATNYAQAEALIEGALALAPGLSRAHLVRAILYMNRAIFGFGEPKRMLQEARHSARIAVEHDETLGEAWLTLGQCAYLVDRNWEEADRLHARALACDPRDPHVLVRMAALHLLRGRRVEAEQSVRAALLIAPASPSISIVGANTFRIMGLFDEAVSICRAILAMLPGLPLFHSVAALSLFQLERHEEALEHAREAARLAPDSATGMQMQFRVHHAAGDSAAAKATLDRLIAWHRTTQHIAQWISGVFHHIGDTESHIEWLEEAERAGEYWYPFTTVEVLPDSLRNHPRFRALVARIREADGLHPMIASPRAS